MMSTTEQPIAFRVDLELAGVPMTRAEFDAIEDYDEFFLYELIRGVLVVRDFPDEASRLMCERLGYWIQTYAEKVHAQIESVYGHYLYFGDSSRRADRVIWAGLGRAPQPLVDVPAIVIEFPSAGRAAWTRDYIEKRRDYLEFGVREFWVINRFERLMTVYTEEAGKPVERRIAESEVYQSPLLQGFELPLARLLAVAGKWE